MAAALDPQMFREQYADVFSGNAAWNAIPVAMDAAEAGQGLYPWDPDSTYIQEPPFFAGLTPETPPTQNDAQRYVELAHVRQLPNLVRHIERKR